jgi:DNA polymerase elongation subunit (family B)
MSYVDAILDRAKDRIHIVERDEHGNRVYKEMPVDYTFYYDDPKGKQLTIYRTPVTKFTTRSNKEFRKEMKMHSNKKLWESDCNPIFRCLENNYMGINAPKLHTCFFDIESDFDEEQGGYAPTDNPFNKITAITVYLDWCDKLVTLALPPPTISWETASEIANKFEDCYLFEREADMLDMFLTLIDDADVLSGWNSEGYDIPYTVGRIVRSLAKDDLRRLCLWNQMPKLREFERYGAKSITYDLVGRVHLDYMQLYRKYTYEERHSYSLDAIGEYELGERKVAYDGTLDQLYKQDFYKFLDYNRQDTRLLARLDAKLKFLDLANELAHDNTVLLQTTMGAVAVTDQAITNEAHRQGYIVPSRKARVVEVFEEKDNDDDDDDRAAGAYVAQPKVGMHQYIGAIDINSLYPSTIRALNMGPETIVGQLRPIMTDQYIAEKMADKPANNGKVTKGVSFAAAWEGLFGSLEYLAVMNMDKGTEITIDWEGNNAPTTHTAEEVYNIIFGGGQNWMISANGTIFTYDIEGIIPSLLARWYAERKVMQAKKKESTEKADIEYWDKKQQVKKINLNSLYGALLNEGCRFHDHRMGQSTTLTGRIIAKHMDATVNEAITGKYEYDGDAIVYGDTDSCYFSAWPMIQKDVEAGTMEWTKDLCVQLYDSIADKVNDSFPIMMEKECHCPRSRGSIIKGGRELIATNGLFIKKKRYAVLIFDMEGTRYDLMDEAAAKKKGVTFGVGKIKAMGLDLKRSDTPKIVQDFLSAILLDTLTHVPKEKIIDKICKFKEQFAAMPAWEKGTPKRVNNLTSYGDKLDKNGTANLPGHVRAAINWNNLRRMHGDNFSMKIVDGMKTIVCKLKPNPMGYKSVAYPIDVLHVPDWFKELPFDNGLMESTIVDKKVENLLGVLKWDLANNTQINSKFDTLFTFN